ncbi:MaoC family dehydratase N-terminal domain-containing protein [Ramlibacter sp.]|uniref:FAS1-like dehydratase domain-containing protein n=1 Tax=Ramlibacter sp. TaxID=1917967 RepID=UPI0035AF134C
MSLALTPEDIAGLQAWTGRTETLEDTATLAPLRGLAATLDIDAPFGAGSPVPPLWHWLYFLPQAPQSQIGPDGHPRRGGFLPPVPLPRRMWAGSQLEWTPGNPLRAGDAIRRTSRIASVTHKQGRTGEMVFVKVEHQIANAQGPALVDRHDIVYRSPPQPGEPAPAPTAAEAGATWQKEWLPDAVMLFRYSALTFNGHRIHYDRPYVTQEEGYPGLVVHGPLIATLLMDLVREHCTGRTVTGYQFRAVRPTFDGRPMRVNGTPAADGRSVRLWAQDADGWLTMTAEATLA